MNCIQDFGAEGLKIGTQCTWDAARGIRGYALAAWFVLLATGSTSSCLGQAFEAEGTISCRLENRSVKKSYETSWRFLVKRNGAQWNIRTIDDKQAEDPRKPLAYTEVGGDGIATFLLEQFDEKKSKRLLDERTLKADHFAFGTASVSPGVVPPVRRDCIHLVWLAYVSAPYFTSLKDATAVAPRMGEMVSQRAEWVVREGLLFMSEVKWFSDGSYSTQERDRPSAPELYAAPYSGGFLESEFKNVDWTNFNGMLVPRSFTLLRYVPVPNSNSATNLDTVLTAVGKMTSLRKLSGQGFLPVLSTKTVVDDYRQLDDAGHPVNYVLSKTWYVTRNELRQHMLTASGARPPTTNKARLLILFGLVVISVIFAFGIYRGRSSQRETQ